MHKKPIFFVTLAMLGLFGCQTHSPDKNPLIRITKSLGTKQCEAVNAEVKLQQLKRELEQQKIKVFAAEIGTDHMFHIALCGAADGKMAIFKIKQHSLIHAEKLGYTPKS